MDTPRHSVSVVGVVVDGTGAAERVLLIRRRDDGRWEPPGGVLELAETPAQGVRREVAEETGYVVEVGALTGVYKNVARGVVTLAFRCRVVDGEPTTSDETSAVAWCTRAEVERDVVAAHAVRVADALEAGTAVPVRVHDGVRLLDGQP